MIDVEKMMTELGRVFEERQAAVLAKVVAEAAEAGQRELVKIKDFSELKEIVRSLGVTVGELAEAQKRTEQRVEELAVAQRETRQEVGRLDRALTELAEAQKRTEQRVEELAVAQRETRQEVGRLDWALTELAEAQKRTEIEIRKLAGELRDTKTEVGGLARSMAYALENEAYRALPAFLKEHGISITERFVRTEIGGEEINLFVRGKKDGREVIIVGESELKVTSIGKLKQLERKAAVVQESFPGKEIIKLLITHYARPAVLEKAKEKGIIVIQSFEWL
jgi:chromosome segregation ATPase